MIQQIYIVYGRGLPREDTISECWVSYLEHKDLYYGLPGLTFWTRVAEHMIGCVKKIHRDKIRRYHGESKVSLNQRYMNSKEEIGNYTFPRQGDFTKKIDLWDYAMRLGKEKYRIIRGLINGEEDEYIAKN